MGWTMVNGKFQWNAPAKKDEDPQIVALNGQKIDTKLINTQMLDAEAAWKTANSTPEARAKNPFDYKSFSQQMEMGLLHNSAIDKQIAEIRDANAQVAASAAAAAKAAKDKADKIIADAKARSDARAAGEQAATYLETSAEQRATANKERISGLYGGMEASAKKKLDEALKQVEADFANAEVAATKAGQAFESGFKPSTAYQGVPITTLEAGTNPLLASLQQQGAGTEQVQAATNLASQTAGATSDLQKWAMSQLNVGQQNFDVASLNAAQQALASSLQGLAGKQASVKTGMGQDYLTRLEEISQSKATDEKTSEAEIQKLIDQAAQIRADVTQKAGVAPAAGSAAARQDAVNAAPNKYANFAAAVKALNPKFDPKKAGKTAEQAFPALAAAFKNK